MIAIKLWLRIEDAKKLKGRIYLQIKSVIDRNHQYSSHTLQRKFKKKLFVCFAGKYKDNEAIEFSFDLNKDVPEDVAQEMVCIFLISGDRYKRGVWLGQKGMIFQS